MNGYVIVKKDMSETPNKLFPNKEMATQFKEQRIHSSLQNEYEILTDAEYMEKLNQ